MHKRSSFPVSDSLLGCSDRAENVHDALGISFDSIFRLSVCVSRFCGLKFVETLLPLAHTLDCFVIVVSGQRLLLLFTLASRIGSNDSRAALFHTDTHGHLETTMRSSQQTIDLFNLINRCGPEFVRRSVQFCCFVLLLLLRRLWRVTAPEYRNTHCLWPTEY